MDWVKEHKDEQIFLGCPSDFDKDLNVLMNGAKLKIGGFVLQKSYRFLVCRSSLQHNSQQAPKVFNYLCKEEHLENPRAW